MGEEMEFSRESVAETRAMEEAYALYEKLNPRPVFTRANKLALLGWEFWLILITALAATVLTALRTGTAFFVAAVGQFSSPGAAVAMSDAGGYVEAAAAILAFEGLLLGIGAMDGQRRYREALSKARAAGRQQNEVITEMNRTFKYVSVGLALGTSVMAGGAVSANIIPTLDPGVRQTLFTVLSVLMAFASILAFTTGEMLGMMSEEATAKVDAAEEAHDQLMKAWTDARANYWSTKRMNYMRRVDPDLVRELRGAAPKVQSEPTPAPAVPTARTLPTKEVIDWYLREHPGMTLTQLSALDVAKKAYEREETLTGGRATPEQVTRLAQAVRTAVSREKSSNGNGNGHSNGGGYRNVT